MASIDARPIISAGGEPLETIMGAVGASGGASNSSRWLTSSRSCWRASWARGNFPTRLPASAAMTCRAPSAADHERPSRWPQPAFGRADDRGADPRQDGLPASGALHEIPRIAVADALGGAAVHLRVGWEPPCSLTIIDDDAAAAPGFRISSP
jgi:hypothetical protein